MKSILSESNREVLRCFASPDTLIGLDFDGTLAPIVRDRNRASLRQATRRLLTVLAACYRCVVVSGRATRDVRRRLAGTGIKRIIGNHGIEPWSVSPALEKSVQGWLPLIKAELSRFRGVDIEDKRYSLAIHYRGVSRKREARDAIIAAIRKLPAKRVIGGKQVFNVLPSNAPHKGLAFRHEMARLRCRRAIYIGDDDTDEDVFALPGQERLMTIRVGLNRESLAGYYIRRQSEIDRVIRLLIALRSTLATGRRRHCR